MRNTFTKYARIIFILTIVIATLVGCSYSTEADRVSYNISQDADNFNQIRQLTVINCIKGDV